MEEMQENKRFMVRQWEEIRKAGGISFSIEQMNAILQESEVKMLDREELIARVVGYFNSCVKVAIDEDTGEKVTTWCRNPTKSGLALVLGIDKQTLLDYVKGVNSAGNVYSYNNPDSKRIVATEDFDVLRKAYSLIESFYEERLGDNRNNAGTIYWLNNANNTKWSNEQEFKFGTIEQRNTRPLTAKDLLNLGALSQDKEE
jgi:hypothetical protein